MATWQSQIELTHPFLTSVRAMICSWCSLFSFLFPEQVERAFNAGSCANRIFSSGIFAIWATNGLGASTRSARCCFILTPWHLSCGGVTLNTFLMRFTRSVSRCFLSDAAGFYNSLAALEPPRSPPSRERERDDRMSTRLRFPS